MDNNLNNFWETEEGDNWYKRNKEVINDYCLIDDITISNIKKYNINKENILEIGCSNGSRLNKLKTEFKGSNCYGIDVSEKAIQNGKSSYRNLHLEKLCASKIGKFKDNFFDIIIFGHCLMVIEPDLFQNIINEIHKILKKNGNIFIIDWYSKNHEMNIKWKHNPNYHCNKFDYSSFFTIFPNYVLINRTFLNHDDKNKKYEFNNLKEVMTIDIIRKF